VTERIASSGSGLNHANEMKGPSAACKEYFDSEKKLDAENNRGRKRFAC
jgi:hypothetical protein